MIIRAILIDDEKDSLEILERELRKHCPYVDVLDMCETPADGIKSIRKYEPDLIFLDIEMPGLSGFDLLSVVEDISFEVIITTAHPQYAVDSFNINALDYLQKPFSGERLKSAVEKIIEKNSKVDPSTYLEELKKNLNRSKRIGLRGVKKIEFIPIEDIIYCEADGNITRFFLTDNKRAHCGRNLGAVEESLSEYNFFRIHNSYFINLDHLTQYDRGERYVVMSNGATLNVSQSKVGSFLDLISKISI